jgi:demethylmenaquinone methyltransferase/2-methoxy-6-polyprenyl-1,4-benzoquinol methylase
MSDERLVAEQVAYYRARAGEYDQWFLREGRYDRGPEHRAIWFGEIDAIKSALALSLNDSDVLELACGTGLWTEQLARRNHRVLAVDASPEVIAINRGRAGADHVQYEVADILAWQPPRLFDAVFFAFWLSHVPPMSFDNFWRTVESALKPGGRVFVVDSLLEQTSTATDHQPVDDSGVVRRKLNDGREFDIIKVFYEPETLRRRLGERGWKGWVKSSGRFFLFGELRHASSQRVNDASF